MKSEELLHIQHLKWALGFSQMDLDERGEYLEDVKTKIYEFIRDSNLQAPEKHPPRLLHADVRSYVGELASEDIKGVRRAFDYSFRFLADQARIVHETSLTDYVRFYLGALTPTSRFFQSITIPGDPVSQSAVALQIHFVRSGLTGERILKCPECGNIFIRERKRQKYCSPTCARAVANREYYERKTKEAAKAAEAQPAKKPVPKQRRKTTRRKTKKAK